MGCTHSAHVDGQATSSRTASLQNKSALALRSLATVPEDAPVEGALAEHGAVKGEQERVHSHRNNSNQVYLNQYVAQTAMQLRGR
jgi:hypothetical protein